MRRLICTALLALVTSAPVYAGNLLDLAVIDRDSGETLKSWRQDGKFYVAGVPGHRYSVRMTNRSGGRVLAVLSVDGVNAVSGETAATSQTGYVLDAWQSTEIKGWRKSLDEVAQFNFTALPESYAALTGRPSNVGVIGVAVFTERAPIRRIEDKIAAAPAAPPVPGSRLEAMPSASADMERSASAKGSSAHDAVSSKAKPQQLGTGHGDREFAQVSQIDFKRASNRPAETLSIWYDSRHNLVARGIIPRAPLARHVPNPFPNAFVQDPPRR